MTVMEAISRKLPWQLLYADDVVVVTDTEQDLTKRLNESKGTWKIEA